MQEDISISSGGITKDDNGNIQATYSITGTLKYLDEGQLVDEWGAGNFIALNFANNDYSDLTSVRVGLDPSQSSGLIEIINDPDKNGAFKVTTTTQKFKVISTDGTHTCTQTFDLSGLTLESA